MGEMSRQEILALLAEPHLAHLVTVRPDGRPHVAPLWYMEEDGRAFVIAEANAVKIRNIQRNPAVSLSIATDNRPYKYVILQGEGTVTERNLAQVVERLCVRYDGPERGAAFAKELLSDRTFRLIDIRVTRMTGWKDDE